MLTAAASNNNSSTNVDESPGVGDLLEFWDPQTQSIALGIVVEADLEYEVLRAWTLDGKRVRVKPDQITLRLPRVMASAPLAGKTKHSPAVVETHILALLRLIVNTSYQLMRNKLSDALLAVHSQTPATTPLPVARIAARALAIARVRNWDASPLTQVAALLGTHIWLTNNPIYYWSFSNATSNQNHYHGGATTANGRNKTYWVPYESIMAEESQYIVSELGTHDMVAFGELQKYLEPVNSIELSGDLALEQVDSLHNLENGYDIGTQETAMGIPNDRSFSAANTSETLSSRESALKQRLSVFSDVMMRSDRNNMAAIQEILLNNFWKRLDAGALYVEDTECDYHLPVDVKASPKTGRIDLNQHVPIVLRLVTEAEIMAGEVCALFGAKNDLPLFYSRQVLTRTDGIGNEMAEYICGNRSLDGTLNGMGAYMADRVLMGASETVTEPKHPHFGLGVSAGYVSVARPLDDVRQLISQYQLTAFLTATKHLYPSVSSIKKWPLLSSAQLQDFYKQNHLSERHELFEYLEKASARYWTLRWLQKELERSSGYFVFKCVVLSSAAQYPDLAKSYCLELNMEVDIVLTQRTPKVNMGDRLMCTGILRLVPTTGELVLGI
ncbi:hypothetical protein D0Z03_002437 [Geotrichum reessii]|nr:hypothetical protein D0Z03_002437 [Galactomyces reessii]